MIPLTDVGPDMPEQQKKDKHGVVDLTATSASATTAEQQRQGKEGKTLKATVSKNNQQPVFTTVKENKGGRHSP